MSDFPLPIRWRTPLAPMEWVVHAPLLIDGVLLVRVRQDLFRIRAADGELVGRTAIDPDEGQGIVCLAHGGCAIVDVGNAGQGRSTIVAVDPAGQVRWRTPLEMQLLSETGSIDKGELLLACHQAGVGNWLVALDAASGAVRARTKLPRGGAPSTALRWGAAATLVASPAGVDGLFRIGEGGSCQVLDERPVPRLVGDGDRALVAAGSGVRCELALYDAGKLAPRWRAPAAGFAVALDGGEVACLDEGGKPALRDAASGDIRWRADGRIDPAPTRARLVGPLALFGGGPEVSIYRRSDGRWIGESYYFGVAALADGGALYIGGGEQIAAADLSGL